MLVSPTKKTKINLGDYDYQKDVDNRLLMSNFTTFDVEVLEEILNSSIEIEIDALADNLNSSTSEILPVLEKLHPSKLFDFQKDRILVNKEMRKYYEFQILKFDNDFAPSMEFFQSLLRKVPIHVQPIWYSVPRTSDNIFQSIIDKYLITPQSYRRYLNEIHFSDPIMQNIIDDVFASSNLKIRSKELREKYHLSREEFEHCMLHLEFNFICCLSYNRIENEWKEVVTPFYEWKEFLINQKINEPEPCSEHEKIEKKYPSHFSFIELLNTLLEEGKKTPLSLKKRENSTFFSLDPSHLHLFSQILNSPDPHFLHTQIVHAIYKLQQLRLIEFQDNLIQVLDYASDWLEMSILDQAVNLYRLPLNRHLYSHFDFSIFSDRCIREIEHSLETISLHMKWIYFDEFTRILDAQVGKSGHTTLKRKGRHWKYALPEYSKEEYNFIHEILFERLPQSGIMEVGLLNGRNCLRLTEFGKSTLGFN